MPCTGCGPAHIAQRARTLLVSAPFELADQITGLAQNAAIESTAGEGTTVYARIPLPG